MKNKRVKDIQARLKKGFDQTQYMSRTFGVELEFVYNCTKSQKQLAQYLREYTEESVEIRNWSNHSSNPRNNFDTWVLTTDGSLNHRNGWELVSPILDESTDGLVRLNNMLLLFFRKFIEVILELIQVHSIIIFYTHIILS